MQHSFFSPSYDILGTLSHPDRQREGGVFLREILISFFVSVAANVVSHHICKWLDRNDSDNQPKKKPPKLALRGFRFVYYLRLISFLATSSISHIRSQFKYSSKFHRLFLYQLAANGGFLFWVRAKPSLIYSFPRKMSFQQGKSMKNTQNFP